MSPPAFPADIKLANGTTLRIVSIQGNLVDCVHNGVACQLPIEIVRSHVKWGMCSQISLELIRILGLVSARDVFRRQAKKLVFAVVEVRGDQLLCYYFDEKEFHIHDIPTFFNWFHPPLMPIPLEKWKELRDTWNRQRQLEVVR